MLLSFTYPTFVDGFELSGNVCGAGGRITYRGLTRGEQVQ
jgi:hypothetical protein